MLRRRRKVVCHTLQEHQLSVLTTIAQRAGISRSELVARILEGMLPALEGMKLHNAVQVSMAVFAMLPAKRTEH